jgi:hypothetical protein
MSNFKIIGLHSDIGPQSYLPNVGQQNIYRIVPAANIKYEASTSKNIGFCRNVLQRGGILRPTLLRCVLQLSLSLSLCVKCPYI